MKMHMFNMYKLSYALKLYSKNSTKKEKLKMITPL